MSFEWPWLLWSLGLVPPLVGGYLLWQRRRTRYAVRFTNLELLANVAPRTPSWRRHVPAALYLIALSTLLVSLARPQATVQVPKEQATVVLLVDVSGSMNATDVQPSRLASAQQAAKTFAERVPRKFKIGVVAFSSTAETVTPPTTDRDRIRDSVDALQARGGTAMGDAITRALETARLSAADAKTPPAPGKQPVPGDTPPTVLLLLSDGANTIGEDPLAAAMKAHQRGVSVFTVALGTQTGVVELPDRTGLIRRVPVPPDESTLRRIAEITDARFFRAPNDRELNAVYKELGSRIGFERAPQEVTALFSAAAALLLLAGGALSLLWLNRFP
jgi:Ca-activated chloride channel family protein